VLDAGVLNQGGLALLVLLWMLLVRLPLSFTRRFQKVRRRRLQSVAVYILAAALVFAANHLNNRIAHRRAERLIIAVEAFKETRGTYPNRLDELVPRFIDRVPAAKYCAGPFGRFMYIHYPRHTGDHPILCYTALPPFGLRTYSFEEGRWGYLD
jgi:hypothetical protein